MEFNEAEKSTILRCDVHDAILKIGNKCHATFFGLLDPLRLDFIKNDFQESPKMLYSVGSVSDIPMRITFFSPRDAVYVAWRQSNGHCHAHVWWTA